MLKTRIEVHDRFNSLVVENGQATVFWWRKSLMEIIERPFGYYNPNKSYPSSTCLVHLRTAIC